MAKARPKSDCDTAVIGAGISGLAAARSLARLGHEVVVLEASATLGGLAGGFEAGGRPAERFYHYVCASDRALLGLCRELGILSILRWRRCGLQLWNGTGFFGCSSPAGLAGLPLPAPSKLKLAWGLGLSRLGLGGPGEAEEAGAWLDRSLGKPGYELLFKPLLLKKFGKDGGRISAAWMHRRMVRAAAGGSRFASIEGGYAAFFRSFAASLAASGASIRFSSPVASLRRDKEGWLLRGPGLRLRARRVLAALPAPILLKIAPKPPQGHPWPAKAAALRYQSLVQPLFHLRRPLLSEFWTNLNSSGTPFTGAVQYDRLDGSGRSLLYLPLYTDPGSTWARATDAKLLRAGTDLLSRLEPSFTKSDVLQSWVFRERHAQPWVGPDFGNRRPGLETAWPGLYLLEASRLFPEDRSLNACILAAQEAVSFMESRR